MFNSDDDDSENDADYVPPADDLEDEEEDEAEISDCEAPTPEKKEIIPDKSYKEKVWESFLSGTKCNTPSTSETTAAIPKSDQTDTDKSESDKVKNEIAKPLENDSKLLENDLKPLENDSKPLENDSKPLENDSKPLENDSKPLESDSKPQTGSTVVPKAGIGNKRRFGLDAVVGKLNKKSKTTVLQKSLEDWNTFKREEGIEDTLRTFNKGKGGYIQKQQFLLKSDLASFEKERELRLSKK